MMSQVLPQVQEAYTTTFDEASKGTRNSLLALLSMLTDSPRFCEALAAEGQLLPLLARVAACPDVHSAADAGIAPAAVATGSNAVASGATLATQSRAVPILRLVGSTAVGRPGAGCTARQPLGLQGRRWPLLLTLWLQGRVVICLLHFVRNFVTLCRIVKGLECWGM